MSQLARMRLLQIASQAFPIGGYSHSQGLESAIEQGIVRDEMTVGRWIEDMLRYSLFPYEALRLNEMIVAWESGDDAEWRALNAEFLASRETAEFRAATVQMGHSLRALLAVLPDLPPRLRIALEALQEPALPTVWSGLCVAWSLDPGEAISAYLWSFAENQVLVAMKAVPIGQSAGQRILLELGAQIAEFIESGRLTMTAAPSNFAPGLAMVAARHETQYSRLFRS